MDLKQELNQEQYKAVTTTEGALLIIAGAGAILVLILSFTLDILEAGIVAVTAMSLGMAIPIVLVAYLAWFGRKGLFFAFKTKEGFIRKLSFGIEIFGYSLLIILPFFPTLGGTFVSANS